ncbi:hypothetical protein EDD85DRAFT_1026858 [Armillaria nabsnona]|nr:hypothetical protein EDD85DRAFT_1026858 [Armillaria nabsnona]
MTIYILFRLSCIFPSLKNQVMNPIVYHVPSIGIYLRIYTSPISTDMVAPPPDTAQWRDLLMFVGVVAEQPYLPLHEDALVVYSDVEDVTDEVKLEKSRNPRKRDSSVDWDSGNSSKRVKNAVGEVAATSSVSKIPANLTLVKESGMVAEDHVAVSAPVLRLTKPLPNRIGFPNPTETLEANKKQNSRHEDAQAIFVRVQLLAA